MTPENLICINNLIRLFLGGGVLGSVFVFWCGSIAWVLGGIAAGVTFGF